MGSKLKKRPIQANGRNKGDSKHVRHYNWQLLCPAWKALSMTARCLEMELKALHNGDNNGDLFLSVREAAKRLGVAHNTANKAFKELEEKGFIKPNEKGSFTYKLRHATSWVLTEFEYHGQLATKDFMRWRPEEKTRTQKLIPTVSKNDTASQNLRPITSLTVPKFDADEAQNALVTAAIIDTQLVYHTGGNHDA